MQSRQPCPCANKSGQGRLGRSVTGAVTYDMSSATIKPNKPRIEEKTWKRNLSVAALSEA